jgi:hypothetical protein
MCFVAAPLSFIVAVGAAVFVLASGGGDRASLCSPFLMAAILGMLFILGLIAVIWFIIAITPEHIRDHYFNPEE